jgi:predicted phosphodiesterase
VKRVAAIYDIHGNLPALEPVLDEIRRADVDCVVVGGDVVPGPMPHEALACLLDFEVPVHFIQGNGEVAVLAVMTGADPGPMPEQAREAVGWSARQLRPEHQMLFEHWPKTMRLEIQGLGSTLFCHGTPRHENECFTRLTPGDRLLPIFGGLNAAVIVCGHTHMQFDRIVGTTRVVNAGSVGMPFGEAGADWLLLGPGIELRHTAYDLEKAAQRIRDTPYPQAEQFAAHSVLSPPSEAQMLEVLSRAELKYG